MDIGGIQNGLIGMAIFDMWEAAVSQGRASGKASGSPLVDAAVKAFEGYINSVEQQDASKIAGLSTYALNPQGTGVITTQQMAPLLAMNVMG